ncbi:MAG: hypothetical protein IKG40_02880 [Bacilli bacterium]|nr:hypothetical protein [Bacilli bacterium]
MEKKSTGKTVIIVILLLAVIGLGGYIVYDKFIVKDETKELQSEINALKLEIKTLKEKTQSNNDDEIVITDLYGTYTWTKKYEANVSGPNLEATYTTYNIKLVLNSDGTATYDASNGLEAEQTKGSFSYENGKIIYTREYYNYDTSGPKDVYNSGDDKIETFVVVDKDTLQNTYYDQITALKKLK